MFELGLSLFLIGYSLRQIYKAVRDHWFSRGALAVKYQMLEALERDHDNPWQTATEAIHSVVESPIDWAEYQHERRGDQSEPTQSQG